MPQIFLIYSSLVRNGTVYGVSAPACQTWTVAAPLVIAPLVIPLPAYLRALGLAGTLLLPGWVLHAAYTLCLGGERAIYSWDGIPRCTAHSEDSPELIL